MQFGRLAALLALLACCASAFEPARGRGVSVRPYARTRARVLLAADGVDSEQESKAEDGALYETDEPPKPPKPPVSAAMREKLLKENRALGGDPLSTSGNPILVISAVVALLAVLVIGGGLA